MANFEGALNDTTLMCNVTFESTQISTTWSVGNFRGLSIAVLVGSADPQKEVFFISGDPRPGLNITFGNHITILNWTEIVDGVELFCGTGSNRRQTSVTLRIYSTLKRQCPKQSKL